MIRYVKAFAAAAGVLMLSATPILAAGAKGTGSVIAVDEEADVYTIKGADGKTYEVGEAVVVAEDLKTGDMVEYDLVEAKPVNVKKKGK